MPSALGAFPRDRFEGIKIEATGQNIITLGDGNQVNAQFKTLGESLADLRKAIKESSKLTEPEKVDLVVDVDTLQTQLGRKTPQPRVDFAAMGRHQSSSVTRGPRGCSHETWRLFVWDVDMIIPCSLAPTLDHLNAPQPSVAGLNKST
jgi:hypothetical protein